MALDYFRRPALVGRNAQRTVVATVRGSIRRSNADGTSAAPYFPNASPGQTLNITHQSGSVVVTLTGNDLATVLSDINTALGANGVAVDADGVIEIRSSVVGSTGLISVTGGSAAAGLGFQTFGGTRALRARGSQIPSSPESRLGNPFDIAVLGKGENFTAEGLQRGLSRIASNTDVLWSDTAKERLSMKTVSFAVGTNGEFITPTSSQRLFTSLAAIGGLSASSAKKDLIPYFQLIDTVTGLPATSQVVAVVRGTPSGEPPYANSPSWSDTTGKNVLGQDLAKATAVSITDIVEGRYVSCAGATFLTSGVVSGDYANIQGATNLTKWSNNGKKWVVEEVLSDTVLALRPMSKSELIDILGGSVTDIHPVVELNDEKVGVETFGNITISNGPFAHNVNLVVRPPIPTGASFELRAAVPQSLRDSIGHEGVRSLQPGLLEYTAQVSPSHNGTIAGLVPSLASGNISISVGLIRWNGHVHSIPATTIQNSSLVDGYHHVYWDDSTGTIKVQNNLTATSTSNLFDPSTSTNKGHLIASVVRTGGVITTLVPTNRWIADAARTLTVGVGGQFSTLDAALSYAAAFGAATLETSGTSSGNYPHFEIVLVSDSTFSGNMFFPSGYLVPGITIRGVSKSVTLTMSAPLVLNSGESLEVRDLQLVVSGSPAYLFRTSGTLPSLRLSNITHVSGTVPYVVDSTTVQNVWITGCSFLVSTGALRIGSTGMVHVEDCDFNLVGGVSSPIIFRGTASSVFAAETVTVRRCRFLGTWATASSTALCMESTSATASIVFEDCQFDIGTHTSFSGSRLFVITAAAFLSRIKLTSGTIPVFCVAAASTVSDCVVRGNPEGTTACIEALSVLRTTLVGSDTTSNVLGGVGIRYSRDAISNTITGYFSTGIQCLFEGMCVGNSIALTAGTALPLYGIESLCEDGLLIQSNTVAMPSRPSASPTAPPIGIVQNQGPCTRMTISGNRISLGGNGGGIQIGTSVSAIFGAEQIKIIDNLVTIMTTASGLAIALGLYCDGILVDVERNFLSCGGLGSASGVYGTGTIAHLSMTQNYIYTECPQPGTGGAVYITTPGDTQKFIGNTIDAGSVSTRVSGLRGISTNNRMVGTASFFLTDIQGFFAENFVSSASSGMIISTGQYNMNTFNVPNVTMANSGVGDVWFTNNLVTGTVNGSGSPTVDNMVFSGNKVTGNTTLANASDTKLFVVGNELLANLTISNGTEVVVSSSYVGGTLTISGTTRLNVSGCDVRGTSTHAVELNDGVIDGCNFNGTLNITGFGSRQLLSNCYIEGKVSFSSSITGLVEVTNNVIHQNTRTQNGLEFTASNSFNATRFLIANNQIILGDVSGTGGNAIQGHAIYFADQTWDCTITGNNIKMSGSSDPGGTGTFTYAAVRIEGVTYGLLVSGNMIDKPSQKTFRTAALVLNYQFVSCTTSVQEVGGSGNMLRTDGTTSGATGTRGDVITFVTSAGSFSL